MAHAALGKAFPDMPVVMTTSSETGLSALLSLSHQLLTHV